MTRFMWIKRKPVAAVFICMILVAASLALWQMSQAEAATLYPHPGLVGWWRFDEGSGTVAKDSSGYGNDGTLLPAGSEPQWVDGKYGKALSFDGVNDYVEIAHHSSLSPSSAITLEAWVKPALLSTMQVVVTKSTTGQDLWVDYALTYESSNIFRGIFVIAGEIRVVDSLTHSDINVWHHVSATFDGNTLKIYVNGVEEGTASYSGALGTSTNELQIGKQATTYYFNGTIDDVRIYNRALSATEIQENFQNIPDLSSRLLAKVPKGTTQFIVTLSWQGVGSINITIESPSENYTEEMVPVYQKIVYSPSSGDMLNIKRLSVSVTTLSSDENWYIVLEFDDIEDYRITVEIQK